LTITVSIPADPVPLIAKVIGFAVAKTVRSLARRSSMSARNAGSRWPMVGVASAASTRGGTGDGPGPRHRRRGSAETVGITVIYTAR
jgi:hypothetical protein